MMDYNPDWYENNRVACDRTFAEIHENDRTFLDRWRLNGGYAGALARLNAEPRRSSDTLPASGHMPFSGHRHMGEIT